jgi:hypothetical protein
VLDDSPYKWLHEMLEVFNHGDLHAYDALCTKYASVLNAQPALVEHERRLREKVRGRGRGAHSTAQQACRLGGGVSAGGPLRTAELRRQPPSSYSTTPLAASCVLWLLLCLVLVVAAR